MPYFAKQKRRELILVEGHTYRLFSEQRVGHHCARCAFLEDNILTMKIESNIDLRELFN